MSATGTGMELSEPITFRGACDASGGVTLY